MDLCSHLDYPLLLEPVYKDYVWGGDRIPRLFNRDLPAGIYAESWEICDRSEGMSVVKNGPLAGRTLHELVAECGESFLGAELSDHSVFPLLIKIIDPKQRLSVQVHPDEDNAPRVKGEPKTEMWYALEADPGARVFVGFKPGVNQEDFERVIGEGKVEDMLEVVPVTAGDAIYVPGGRIHAIDTGCLLLEIQQNSDTTYRVYDWGRLGSDGKPRPLHVGKALAAINWDDEEQVKFQPHLDVEAHGNLIWTVLDSTYFTLERIALTGPMRCENYGDSFHAFFTWAGAVRIVAGKKNEAVSTGRGVSALLPACVSEYELVPENGAAEILRISVP